MAYTQGFDHDIFISFSHEDNLAREGERGWVDQFRESLEIWLRRRGLRGLDIWWDKEQLRGNTDFDARIEACLKMTAVLVVLHSRNYRKSDYCRQELDWFVGHAERHGLGLAIGDNRRILNVLINNIPHLVWTDTDHWTHHLAGATGFVIHDADKVDDFGDPLSPASFDKVLKPLVTALDKTLHAFPYTVTKAQGLIADNIPRVFLADVADTLRPFRKRLIKEIGERAQVLDAIPPPSTITQHDQAVASALEMADLSIHLLDQWPGRELDDDASMTFPRRQADLLTQSEAPALLWVTDTLTEADIEEPSQKAWLDELEQASRESGNYQFIREGREPFVNQVLDTLERLAAQRQVEGHGPPRFLIDTHRKDQRFAYALAAGLAERIPDLDVEFTKDAEGASGWTEFESAVRQVKDLIVLFGQVAPGWVRGRVERAWKVAATQIGRDNPSLENIWVLLLPQCPGMPDLPRLIQVNVLDNRASENIDPNNLAPLFRGDASRGGA